MISSLVSKTLAASEWTGLTGPETGQKDVPTIKSLETVFSNVLNVVVALAGIVVFIMLIAGGFRLLFSGGNPDSVKKATGTITWAIIGLLLLLSIWLIFRFIEEFTGVTVTEFGIPN